MMYPVAVDGQMPFVDHKSYRDQQIKKVIQKHRAKRQRESFESRETKPNTQTLHTTVYRISQHPRLSDVDSTPTIDNRQEDNVISKRNILHAIKRFFSNNNSNKSSKSADGSLYRTPSAYKPRYSRNSRQSAPIVISQARKTSLNSNSPPGVSPKRQRRRTVSNIGSKSIMETIEEIPEHIILADESDSESSLGSSSSLSTYSISSSLDLLLHEATGHASYTSSRSTSRCEEQSIPVASTVPCSA